MSFLNASSSIVFSSCQFRHPLFLLKFDGFSRACLKKAFCKMCVTICGRFCPDEGA
ncbi:DUF6783 domain-containing protein, partial [Blautia acetigignens]|uniref:DUF6783 domain-containing protein n=1 Tax=Blautia acetigignens TaxID=2981783 RepID=UPI003D7313D8